MSRYASAGSAGWREIAGKRTFYRSRAEANYARFLEAQKQNGEIKDWRHEVKTFWFKGVKRGCVSYLPDFWVLQNSGFEEFHEVKGWMDKRSATKLKRMKKYFPLVRVVVIDQKWSKRADVQLASVVEGWEL